MSNFITWLIEKIEDRGWSYNEFARRANLSSGGVSRVLSKHTNPGYEFAVKTAFALEIPIETVLRKTNLIPPGRKTPEEYQTDTIKKILETVQKLNKEDQDEVFEFSLWKYRRSH